MITQKGIEPPPKVIPELARNLALLQWFNRIHEFFPKVSTYTKTLNPASVASNTTAEQTFTVTGLETSDIIFVNKPTLTAGLGIAGARVSAANTLAITFINATGGAIDPPSEDYVIGAIRK